MPRMSLFLVELSPAERAGLEATSRRYAAPYRDVVRDRIVLLAAEGRKDEIEVLRRDPSPEPR